MFCTLNVLNLVLYGAFCRVELLTASQELIAGLTHRTLVYVAGDSGAVAGVVTTNIYLVAAPKRAGAGQRLSCDERMK